MFKYKRVKILRKFLVYSVIVVSTIFLSFRLTNRFYESALSSEVIRSIQLANKDSGDLKLEAKCSMYFDRINVVDPDLEIDDHFKYFEPVNKLVESMQKIKIFNKCYVDNEFTLRHKKFEKQLLPFFTNEFSTPIYKNKGQTSDEQSIPIYDSQTGKLQFFATVKWSKRFSYWYNVKNQLRGKGIAITINEGQYSYLINLLRVLAELENKLPIQVIHKGDLRDFVQDMVLDATSGQEVMFVDVSTLIDQHYIKMFKRFSNKWLAMLFSSFEDVILMDVDSIPFINPREFFQLPEYIDSGAVFFKDRVLQGQELSSTEYSLFERMGSKQDFFEIPSSSSLDNYLENQSKHLVDSGIVIMNKKTHFSGLLVSTVLQYWYRASSAVYGDKELFWLGQLISNKPFEIFASNASIVGSLEEINGRHQICSAQLGHLDHRNGLMWLNGGMKNCKKLRYAESDFEANADIRLKYGDIAKLKEYYDAPIHISGAIIAQTWNHTNVCIGYQYCVDKGQVVKFDQKQADWYNQLSNLWNNA